MKSLLRILITLSFSLCLFSAFSQQRTLIAYYDNKNVLVNEDGKMVSYFAIEVNNEELAAIKQMAKNFESILTLTVDEDKTVNNRQNCKITFNQTADSTFLIKMLGGLGFRKIAIAENVFDLNDFNQTK